MASTKRVSQPGKITVEDLLKAVESEEDPSTVEVNTGDNSVLSFVMAYKIKPGEYKVTAKLLYELYKSWTKDPVDRISFSKRLSKYVVLDAHSYTSIDRSAFQVSEEIEKYLRQRSRPVTKVKSFKRHFDNYLKKYSLKPGNYYIESFVLYYLYDKWTYGIKKKQPLGYMQFNSLCQLYFKSKRNSSNRVTWYGVNRDALFKVITLQQIVNIRKGRKQRYGRKKQQKESKEIPSN